MALETFLVALKENASEQTTNRLVTMIRELGGRVEIVAGRGRTIIATFDHYFAEQIRRLPPVRLVGGVAIGKRKLPRTSRTGR
jgi:hypothetical protein